jgi:hypothetical protein
MSPGESDLTPLAVFDGGRDDPSPAARAKDLRARARRLHERLMAAPPVPYFESFDLVRVPYPSRYALLNAATVPTPFCHILNRLFVVQAPVRGRVVTLLISPSDVEAGRATPYFRRLAEALGPLEPAVRPAFAPVLDSVEACLARVGIRPEDVDYLTYDHLHTQDLRRWLGSAEHPGYFPRARLLVTRQEWESTHGLLPVQAEWYCPGGTAGVPAERVELFDGDVMLGESVALVRTPGHTEGNHSIAVRTEEGVFVMSENGVGPDAYSPLASRIPGVARHARNTGQEVVLNGNTLEGGVDQYLSMLVERELAGPSTRHGDFTNNLSTSELTGWPLFPGMSPTFSFGPVRLGAPVREERP